MSAPALALLAVVVGALLAAYPLPARVPAHFDSWGRPDDWGSPNSLAFGMLLGATVVVLGWFWVDEVWARHETRKRFNALTALDDAFMAWLAGPALGVSQMARQGTAGFAMPWPLVGVLAIGAVGFALLLEMRRPYRPGPAAAPPAIQPSRLAAEVTAKIRSGERWAFWDRQTPTISTKLLIVGTGLVLLALGVVSLLLAPLAGWLLLITSMPIVLLWGGGRVGVNDQRLEVRLGLLNVRVLRLPLQEIEELRPADLTSRRGMRWYPGGAVLNVGGSTGFTVISRRGTWYDVGADHPDEVLSVLQAARERA